ncbi:uncharacterized protein LOC117644250 [Thrips palmi]|uniref:Uncharacterized protein LOC117644250 n=1 Tax=Thrips palmi TaxID=161013 RepID=A0A6P8YR14_THRPL|nr:uncharacterized protein LOC117644250 [Thrips palmi]
MKLWLQTRGLPVKGRKAQLIERIRNHKERAFKIDPAYDKGQAYEAKRKKIMAELDNGRKQAPMMPIGALWKPFPSVHIPNNYSSSKARDYLERIPEVRFSYAEGVILVKDKEGETRETTDDEEEDDLYDFSQPTQEDRKKLFVDGTLKRANNFIDSGRVLSVLDCQRDTHYFVKAQVQASLRNKFFTVQIMMAKGSGSICFTDCQCKAKALGRCCHIMAVLLLIGRHVANRGHEAVTCTGRECYWLAAGETLEKRPGVVRSKDEYYLKTKFHRQGHFDPRPTSQQNNDDNTRVEKLITLVSKMPQKILWFYQLQPKPEQQRQRPAVECEEYPDPAMTERLAEMCSHLLWNLNQIRHQSTNQPLHLSGTESQSTSASWFSQRAVRATASVAKQFLGLLSTNSTPTGKINFFRYHLWGISKFPEGKRMGPRAKKAKEAMEYGSAMEGKARRAYIQSLKEVDPSLDVIETGMWVNPKYPMLSCSPDGVIVDVNGFLKLLEIKCPAVLKGIDPAKFETLPKNQLKSFCLKRCQTTGKIELKRNHKWHFQVQMSMDILKLDKCDFIVFSEVNNEPKFLCVEVTYEEAFWHEKRERLIRAHREMLVPEYFLCNAVFQKPILQMVYTAFHEEHDDPHFWYGCDPDFVFPAENESEVLINVPM